MGEDVVTRQATVNTGLAIKNTNSIAATDLTDEIMLVKLPDRLVCWPVLFAWQPPSGDENPGPMMSSVDGKKPKGPQNWLSGNNHGASRSLPTRSLLKTDGLAHRSLNWNTWYRGEFHLTGLWIPL